MARKTVVRRLFKYLPVSVELATAMELQAGAEKGEFTGLTIDAENVSSDLSIPPAQNELTTSAQERFEAGGESASSQPRRSRADALKGDLKGSSTTDAPEAGDAPASEDVPWPEE
jgi:recombinational DNA repair protein RecT